MLSRRLFLGFSKNLCLRARTPVNCVIRSFSDVVPVVPPKAEDASAVPVTVQVPNNALIDVARYIASDNAHLLAISLRNLNENCNRGELVKLLSGITQDQYDKMDFNVVYVLENLSKLGMHCQVTRQRQIILKLLNRCINLKECATGIRVTTVTTALSRMGLNYTIIRHPVLTKFLKRIESTIPIMNAREIVQTLHSLHTMKLVRKDFSSDFVVNVVDTIIREYPRIEDAYKAGLLFSLGRMGFSCQPQLPEWKNTVLKLAEDALTCDDEKSVKLNRKVSGKGSIFTIVAMGLSSMYIPYDELTPSLQEKIQGAYSTADKSIFAFAIASSGKLGVNFQSLPFHVRSTILRQTETFIHSFDLGEVNNLLLGLMKMRLQYSKLDPVLRGHLHSLLLRAIPMCEFFSNSEEEDDEQKHWSTTQWLDSVKLIYGLGQMDVIWTSLPVSLQLSINEAIKQASPLKSVRMANLLQGLCRMNTRWCDLDEEVRSTLLYDLSVPTVFADESVIFLMPSLQALARVKACWQELPTNNIECSLHKFTETINLVGMATMVLSLGQLQAGWMTFLPETQELIHTLIKRYADEMTEQVMANTAQGLAYLTFDCVASSDARLDEIHTIMVDKIVKHIMTCGSRCDARFCTQVSMYHAVLSTQPLYAKQANQLEKAFDSLPSSKFSLPVVRSNNIMDQAQTVCRQKSNDKFTFSVELMKSHLKYGALPVHMTVFKQDNGESQKQLFGFFVRNSWADGHSFARRTFKMMKDVYGYHFPEVPMTCMRTGSPSEFEKLLAELKTTQGL